MKSSETAVSIILPCRDADPALLKRAVDSVLAQTFADFELLIVDDGSKEPFQEALREQAQRDDRIRLLRQEPSGVSAARNRGIREATGEFITLLDADDTVSTWFLEEAVGAIRKLNADFVIGGTCYIWEGQEEPDDSGAAGSAQKPDPASGASDMADMTDTASAAGSAGRRPPDSDPVKVAVELTRERLPLTRAECIGEPYRFDDKAYINRGIAARLVRREFLTEEFLFPEKLRIAEDASWNLAIVNNFRGYYVPGLWYYYWENGKSVSNRYNPRVIKDMEDHLAVIRGQLDLTNDTEYRAFMDLMMDDLRYIYKCMVGNPRWKESVLRRRKATAAQGRDTGAMQGMQGRKAAAARNRNAYAVQRRKTLSHLYKDLPWREIGEKRYLRLTSARNRWKAELYRRRLLFAVWSLRRRLGTEGL